MSQLLGPKNEENFTDFLLMDKEMAQCYGSENEKAVFHQ